jgi:fumarate reductase subunit D
MKNFIETIKTIFIIVLTIVLIGMFMAMHRAADNIDSLKFQLQRTEVAITSMKNELQSVNISINNLTDCLDSSWFFGKKKEAKK